LGKYNVRRFLRNHVDGADDKKTRNVREYRGVDNAQPLCAVDAKITANNAAVLARSDWAGAGGMVTPGRRAHKVLQFFIALQGATGLLLLSDQSLRL
jgi:hypothetical protein